MGYYRIKHYLFSCEATCGAMSPVVQGHNLATAAWQCEHDHGWRIIMGRGTPLCVYCPEHKHLVSYA